VVKYGTGDDDALVILGGNDGLLHAFDDETGEEVWAFVPDVLLGRLKELRPVGGSGTHPYFVDSSARLRTKSDGTKIIVFGLGRGGRAYYGLDVTTKAAPRFLWKVTNGTGGFTELGYTTSEASFSKASGNDVAIVGAGYDTYFDDSASTSANGSGMGRGIFVINLTTGALVSLIQPTGMDFAIPSNVAVADLNGDGVLDRAYVGDLGGQMWRITGALAATRLFCADATCPTTGTNPGKRRIFYAPDIVRDRGFLSVFFGTGDRSNPLRTDVVDRMYGVRDDGTSNLDEGDLIDVTTRVEENGSDEEAELIEELGDTNGWLIRLADRAGEKVLASPAAFFSVFFTTFTPINGVCNAGGDARLYELNYATGGIPDTNADGGETAADRVTDLGRSIPTELTIAILKESQAGSGGSVASSGAVGYVASSGEVDTVELPGIPNNVTPLSWRECSTVVPCLTP
jgi:type IV pilus assembly protein PilY1